MKVDGKEERGSRASAAGKPAAVAAFAHIGPLRAVGQHLVKLRAAQAVPPPAGQALVFDNWGLLLWLGLRRLYQEPAFFRAARPIAGGGLPAVARGEKPGCDFARRRKGSIGRFHSYAAYCLYAVTLRR